MKKLFLAAALLLSIFSIKALNSGNTTSVPKLVGHRGSGYGVENTEEAFRRGAALGYQYVETDIKVTSDKRFVLCHDDDLERWGHSLKIANSTLEQLQAVTLTQTRSGVTYTGRLMELGEFLDLCAELNVKPVIELKSATGVSSSDQSNMPSLIQTIENHGFRNRCIILTSMQPCLEWIFENHPDINRQLLVNASATGKILTWCIRYQTDVDISNTYCTKEAVDKYHEAGLLVNMWTTNSTSGYIQYTQMGCDFITTDRLNAAEMPEVDIPEPAKPEYGGTPDYFDVLENTTILPSSEYSFYQKYQDYKIAELTGKTIRRVIAHNNVIYILAIDSVNAPTIIVFDPQTKHVTPVSTAGMRINHYHDNYQYACSDIALTSCGHLIASNLSQVKSGERNVSTFYRWENDEHGLPKNNPQKWIEIPAASNWATKYVGGTFAYTGDLQNGTLYYSAETPGEEPIVGFVRVAVINGAIIEDEICFAQPSIINAEIGIKELGKDYRFTLSPNKDQFIVTGSTDTYTLGEYKFTIDEDLENIRKYNDLPQSLGVSHAIVHVGVFKYAGAIYAIVPTQSGGQLLDISNGIENATLVQTTGIATTYSNDIYATVGYVSVVKDDDVVIDGNINVLLLNGDKCTFVTTQKYVTSVNQEFEQILPTTYYTLMGLPISSTNIPVGMYIQRQGNKVTKVFIQ